MIGNPLSAIGFGISVRDPPHIDELAAEVSSALAVTLVPSDEPGLRGDYVGEMPGLSLSLLLRVTEPEEHGPAERTALIGETTPLPESAAEWIDIGPYVARLLRDRTGRPWEWRGSDG